MNCQVCGTNNAPGATTCAACGMALTATQGAAAGTAVPFSPALPAGTKLSNGAYTIGKVLGQGGFGITYKGADMSLRRFVAIKEFYPPGCMRQTSLHTIVPTAGSDSEFASSKTRFLEEARTLARFNHPGIVRVFSIFEENNTAYMVMEFLEGQTLGERLKKGPLSESEAVELMRRLGSALEMIHGANLIHRDLKPDNIFLVNDGRAILIDFGTARAYAANRTVRQTAMLTPGYAPLEQYGSTARFGVYSDVYALAATLYHAVTGQAPPPATDRVTGVALRRADTVNPNLSPVLGKALEWGMQLKAEQRPQSISEFLGALSGQTGMSVPHSHVPHSHVPNPMVSAPPPPVASTRTHAVLPPNIAPQNSFPPPIPAPVSYPQYTPQRMVQGGKGMPVLTLGILGLLCCGIAAPIAWIMGNNALEEYGDQDPGDRGSVVAGRIMGMIGTGFLIFASIMWAIIGASS